MWRVIGKNDEVTTCECCGRANLKATVVLTDGEGERRYGSECAARAMGTSKVDVERAVKAADAEQARVRQAAANAEMEAYTAWLLTTYGDTRSNLERRRAWRAVAAA